jgi:hypothetical protein
MPWVVCIICMELWGTLRRSDPGFRDAYGSPRLSTQPHINRKPHDAAVLVIDGGRVSLRESRGCECAYRMMLTVA